MKDKFKGRATEHVHVSSDEMRRFNDYEEKMNAAYWFIEGDDFRLWKHYNEKEDISWKSDGSGSNVLVGTVFTKEKDENGEDKYKEHPVYVELSFALINGVYVCFYECNSTFVNWEAIEDFIEKYVKTYDNGTRATMCSESNFHNCYYYLRDVHKKWLKNENRSKVIKNILSN